MPVEINEHFMLTGLIDDKLIITILKHFYL